MSSIEIRRVSITSLETDAIVNAANSGLWEGGGVCGAIFRAAGTDQMQAACDRIGHCDTGCAVITPGFNLKARYVIHAVGPRWNNGSNDEPKLLYSAYRESLKLAGENYCSSIGFPLISAGIYGYPLDGAWRQAITACSDYISEHPEHDIKIIFAVLDERIENVGKQMLAGFQLSEVQNREAETLRIGEKIYEAVFFHKANEKNGYLSNWYPCEFDVDGVHYTSAEQYIMYQKCMLFNDDYSANRILNTENCEKQRDIGQEAAGFIESVWKGRRPLIALRGIYAKFSQNEELKSMLLSTGDAWLVECAHSDVDWTCGIRLSDNRRFDTDSWRGKNILGFVLMEVRSMLRNDL